MKKRRILPISLSLLLLLTGCSKPSFLPIARDISNVQLMRTMSIDKGQGNNLKVTVSGSVRPSHDGGSPQPPVILTHEAETVFRSVLHIQTYGEGYVSFGHIGQVIVHANAFQEQDSAAKLLDFVERDYETRMSTELYVTEQRQAADILTETASETHSADQRLDSLRQDLGLESLCWQVSAREFLTDIEENGSSLLPLLRLEENDDGMTISSEQMAWFREGRFQGSLTAEQSRGAAILQNKLKSGGAEVTLHDGTKLGLLLTGAKAQWKPLWTDNRLTGLTLTVTLTADLTEEQGNARFSDPAVTREAENRLSGAIQGELRDLLSLSQRENADFLHIGRSISVQCPSRYGILEQNWTNWFPDAAISIQVTSTIQRSFDTK